MKGYVYILKNASFALLKIGQTNRSPGQRAEELSGATGVPTPFRVVFSAECIDILLCERLIHEALAQYRVNPKREFFDMPLNSAKQVVSEIAGYVNNDPILDIKREIQRQFDEMRTQLSLHSAKKSGETDTFPEKVNKAGFAPTDAQSIIKLHATRVSRNKICKSLFGSKNGQRMGFVKQIISEWEALP